LPDSIRYKVSDMHAEANLHTLSLLND